MVDLKRGGGKGKRVAKKGDLLLQIYKFKIAAPDAYCFIFIKMFDGVLSLNINVLVHLKDNLSSYKIN